ncbi:MAG: cytochrome b [Betaproteobacteria bacterium]|nr:cytochrome b [Betaproteobacteria bacterium]
MEQAYTRTAVLLHWLSALAIFCAFPLGVYMHELQLSPRKLQLYSYHKWIGITVLLLLAIRLLWRLRHRPPPLLPGMPRWQELAAQGMHYLLYLLLLAVPLTGWLMSSAMGFPVVWLGVIPLPDLVGKDKLLGDTFKEIHETLNYTLLVLVLIHIAAAIKHHLIECDDTLRRMLPFLKPRLRAGAKTNVSRQSASR